jgi:anti-sigma B factor antagonist
MAAAFDIVHYGPNMYFVGGELDMATAPMLEAAVEESMRRGGVILLDMSAVNFVDSMGIRGIVQLARKLRTGCFVLHGVQERVSRVFELVRLADQPNVHVEACAADPYPASEPHSGWTPAEDLEVRLESLRARHQASGPT